MSEKKNNNVELKIDAVKVEAFTKALAFWWVVIAERLYTKPSAWFKTFLEGIPINAMTLLVGSVIEAYFQLINSGNVVSGNQVTDTLYRAVQDQSAVIALVAYMVGVGIPVGAVGLIILKAVSFERLATFTVIAP